jgi:YihY family inner membrane protein
MAAAIAYHVLFAVVPLTMLVVSLVGVLAGSEERRNDIVREVTEYLRLSGGTIALELSEEGAARLEEEYGEGAVAEIEAALDAIPEAEVQQVIDDAEGGSVNVVGYALGASDIEVTSDNLVVETLRNVVDASGPLTVVSLGLLIYSVSGLFGAVRRSLDFVWGKPRARPLVQGKLIDLLTVFGILLSVVVGLVAIVFTGVIRQFIESQDRWIEPLTTGWLWTVFSIAVSWLMSFAVCALAFRYIPQAKTSFRDVWPGAAIAATSFEVLKAGFGVYVTNFGSFDVVYGTLGGVLLFLLLVYWGSYAFLLSAEVAVEYPIVREGGYTMPERAAPKGMRALLGSALRSLVFREEEDQTKTPPR